MTCFWDGIISKIGVNDINRYVMAGKQYSKPRDFVVALKERSKTTVPNDVLWNGQPISPKQLQENAEWIASYNPDGIGSGHDCSICDPFLILISHIFIVDIAHDYCGHKIKYTNTNKPTKVLSFGSNGGHFW